MTTWLTTAQVLEHTGLAVTQQAIKKAAQREYAHPKPLPGQVERPKVSQFVRKNAAGHWEVRDDWALFQSWRQRGADRAGRVRERQSKEEELTSLRNLCAEQAQRIEELEAALANLQCGKGTVPIEEPGEGTVPHKAAGRGEEGTLPDKDTQAGGSESAKGTVPANIFTDDAALRRFYEEQGCPTVRAFAQAIGMSKSWCSAHLKKARQTA